MRKKWLRLWYRFWLVVAKWPVQRVNALNWKLKDIEKAEQQLVDEVIAEAKLKIKNEEAYRKAAEKQYVVWKKDIRDKLVREYGMCEKCKRTDLKLTLDHIIPQKFLKAVGLQPEYDRDERNFRILCQFCNSNKGHDFDFSDVRTKPLLLEYLKRVPDTKNPFRQKTKQELEDDY